MLHTTANPKSVPFQPVGLITVDGVSLRKLRSTGKHIVLEIFENSWSKSEVMESRPSHIFHF